MSAKCMQLSTHSHRLVCLYGFSLLHVLLSEISQRSKAARNAKKYIYNVYMYVCAYIMEASKKLFQQSNVTTRRYCCT